MTDNPNVTKAVAESAKGTQEKIERKKTSTAEEEKFLTVSSGVVFKIKEVPQVAYVDLRNSLPEPVPPIFYNKEYDREEPNVNDPRYIAQVDNWQVAMSSAVYDISILFGTEIESIPDGMPSHDSEKFESKLKFLLKKMGWSKEDINNISETERYLFWVKYEACPKGGLNQNSDLDKLFAAVGRTSGVPEEDVASAIDGFRD